MLQKLYQTQPIDTTKSLVFQDLMNAARKGQDHAYFFENFQDVRELADEIDLQYENVSPDENETGVRCIKVWGWT